MTEYQFNCNWKSGSNALIQGLKTAGRSVYIHQAVPTIHGESIRVHRYEGMTYRGFQTFHVDNHGSAIGVIPQPFGATLLLPGGVRGVLAAEYRIGDSSTPKARVFDAKHGACSGVTYSPPDGYESVISIRSGGSRQRITLTGIGGIVTGKFSFPTPRSGVYQGHYTDSKTRITFFAWENDQGSARGKPGYRRWITSHDPLGKPGPSWDITTLPGKMQWHPKGEPQGLCVMNGVISVVLRVGGLGKGRFVAVRPLADFATIKGSVL